LRCTVFTGGQRVIIVYKKMGDKYFRSIYVKASALHLVYSRMASRKNVTDRKNKNIYFSTSLIYVFYELNYKSCAFGVSRKVMN
jgi:hypothetical protein